MLISSRLKCACDVVNASVAGGLAAVDVQGLAGDEGGALEVEDRAEGRRGASSSASLSPRKRPNAFASPGATGASIGDEITLVRELGCGRCLAAHALLDLGLGRSVRDTDVELDQEPGTP
jgi:hypothetical protein